MSYNTKIRLADIEATFRRPGPMVATPGTALSAQQLHAQQQEASRKAAEQAELAKRRSKQPVDRNIPDGVEQIVIGDGAQRYNSLRNVERKLDAVMMRKRLDIQDSVDRHCSRYGTMRVWISNTAEDQPWQASGMDHDAFDFSSNVEARFKVKIEGRLLNSADETYTLNQDVNAKDKPAVVDGSSRVEEGNNGEPSPKRAKLSASGGPRKKFSHFLKAITVDFDRSRTLQPDGYTQIEWKRPEILPRSQAEPPREADFDCLEFERKSDEDINITVNLFLDEQPERYRLDPPLAELLDMEEADRKTVLMGIWDYVKVFGLHEEDDSKGIMCNERLAKVSIELYKSIVLWHGR